MQCELNRLTYFGVVDLFELVADQLLILWNAKLVQVLLEHLAWFIAKQSSDSLINKCNQTVLVMSGDELVIGRVDHVGWRTGHLNSSNRNQMKVRIKRLIRIVQVLHGVMIHVALLVHHV